MIPTSDSVMPQPRSSDTFRPRLPTLGHAGSFGRYSGTSCIAWLLLAVCILVVPGESSAMPSAILDGHETTGVDLGALLDAGAGAVVTLVAGMTRLAVHRAVLTARSPVFTTMLSHDTLEASSGEVAIEDMEGPVLRQLVAFLYTGRAPQLPSMAPQLLAAADRYGVSTLKDACEQQLAEQLTMDNAVSTAVLAVTHNSSSLKQFSVTFIRAHVLQVMATKGWMEAVLSHPGVIVQLSHLLTEPRKETSAPATMGSKATLTTEPDSDDDWTPAAVTPSSAKPHTLPHDEAAISHFRSLSGVVKSRKLIQAAQEGAVLVVKKLLAAGADVGATGGGERTALHSAAHKGDVEVVRCLLQGGAEVDARNIGRSTPLHYAAMSGHTAVVRLLLASSADPSARDVGGWTPLHKAAWNGHAEAATALLEVGADKWARDDLARTPTDFARLRNHQHLIQIFQ